jgi:5-formyltetrahydrofolate cyclo-ligase
MSQTKESIRIEASLHRDRLEANEDDLEAAASLFMEHIVPDPGQTVGVYWPKGKEFNPYPVMEILMGSGVEIALPVVCKDKGKELCFVVWDGKGELERGPYGILQPPVNEYTEFIQPDIIIVPLLAFDQRGYRLGYGGGYYDYTIKQMRRDKDVVIVGLAYAEQACLFNLPDEEHDQKMDWVITPAKAYKF